MRNLRSLGAVVAFLAASGCSSIPSYDAPHPSLASPRKVVLVELPMRRDDRILRSEFAPSSPADSAQSREAIADAVNEAQGLALSDMCKALEQQPGLTVEAGDSVAQAVAQLDLANPDVPITRETAKRLRVMTGADDLVRFRVTDYGATPKAWRNAYIAFEVTSTLAIAGVAYAYPATRALAGAYLVQEGVEETAEGYAGFWAVNEVGRPVRIEGELTSLGDGNEAWKGASTGWSDIHLARIVRKVSSEEQDAQRKRATKDAVDSVAAKIIAGLARSEPER